MDGLEQENRSPVADQHAEGASPSSQKTPTPPRAGAGGGGGADAAKKQQQQPQGVTPSRLACISELRDELSCCICLDICVRPCATPCGEQ